MENLWVFDVGGCEFVFLEIWVGGMGMMLELDDF